MKITRILKVGSKYSKKDLAHLLKQPTLANVREGVFSCNNSKSYLLFVDLEKQGKEEKFHFDDFFEGDYFHWDSQTTQHIQSPKIQELVTDLRTAHLFVRVTQKIKSITQPFIYCGRLKYKDYEINTSKPVHIIFQNIDYDDFTEDHDLLEIYSWHPNKAGKTTKSAINKKGQISQERKSKFKKPNETERKGLVTSRVGQGYYRQQILQKWNGRCAITGIAIKSILISSHIVPWSESNDDERLDANNGILLSPNYDALFDKHLITFDENGAIIISKSISTDQRVALGLSDCIDIELSKEMIPYMNRHRERFLDQEIMNNNK